MTITVSEFQPDANIETNTVDSHLGASGSAAWADKRLDTGSSATPSGVPIQNFLTAHATTDTFNLLERAVMLFDTSAIGAKDDIFSAVLRCWFTSLNNSFAEAAELVLVESAPASDTNVVASDFQNWPLIDGQVHFADLEIPPLGEFGGSQFESWQLNAAGRAFIKKGVGAITRFGVRLSFDVDDVEPVWGTGLQAGGTWRSAEGGTGLAPTLIVAHGSRSDQVISAMPPATQIVVQPGVVTT